MKAILSRAEKRVLRRQARRDAKRQKTKRMLGVLFYVGPSVYDPDTTVMVVVNKLNDKGGNIKTGGMANVSVLVKDVDPMAAKKLGLDYALCFECPLRAGGCYVQLLFQGFVATWKAVQTVFQPDVPSRYEAEAEKVIKLLEAGDGPTRFGAYSNMSSVPFEVTEQLLEYVGDRGWTMYLADWKTCDQRFRKFAMASVHTVEDAILATEMGWRFYFSYMEEEHDAVQAQLKAAGIRANECPEAYSNTSCAKCLLCDGMDDDDKRASVYNHAHGGGAVMNSFRKMQRERPAVSSPRLPVLRGGK